MVNKVFCLETEWEQSVYDLKLLLSGKHFCYIKVKG